MYTARHDAWYAAGVKNSVSPWVIGVVSCAALLTGLGLAVHLSRDGSLLSTRALPLPPTIEITDAAGVPISQLRKRNPSAPVILSLPRKKNQDIPVAIRTRNHRAATYIVTLLDRSGAPRDVADASSALDGPGKYVAQLRPTTSAASLKSHDRYALRAVLRVESGTTKRSVSAVVPVTVRWQGKPAARSDEFPAEVAAIDGSAIPRPNVREDTTAITVARGFCVPAVLRVNAPSVPYSIFLQRQKDDGRFETIAKTEGTAPRDSAHQIRLRVTGVSSNRIIQFGVPDPELTNRLTNGTYRVVLNGTDPQRPKTSVRDEAALTMTFTDQFNPLNCS